MKKILTLLLLFTITLFYSIPSEAYTLNGNDIAISDLNGLTLNEVFLDGQLLLNPFFNNTSNYVIESQPGAAFISGGALSFTTVSGLSIRQNQAHSTGDVFYYTLVARRTTSSGGHSAIFVDTSANLVSDIATFTPLVNTYSRLSAILTLTNNSDRFQIGRVAGTATISIDENFLYNLTDLGIGTVSKQLLDHYFNQWKENNAFIQGYNVGYATGFSEGYDDGFDVGYDEGFDDGVASDTSYAVGYALGLSEGQDMETGSSLLILVVAAIGFIMMIFGFTTKRGIFNLLSVGAFIVLGTLLVQFVGFVIIAIGLVIINVYYAFFGNT